MSKLDDIKNNQRIKQYFRKNLEMDDEDFERRFQMYLEIFPFIALDFRLKEDCLGIHKSAKLSDGSKIVNTTEIESSYNSKSESYRSILEDIRASLDTAEIEINLDDL